MSFKILTVDDRLYNNDESYIGLLDDPRETVLPHTESEYKSQYLYDIAKKIRDITERGEWVLFINLFLSCKDDEFHWQQSHVGIALIKFLRILNVHHHIVLLTPYSLEDLLQKNPGNLILSSKGITLTKSTYNGMYDFSEFTELVENDYDSVDGTITQLEGLVKLQFDGDLKPYLLVDFELPHDERHNWANWWGVVQLTDVHRDIFSDELLFSNNNGMEFEYPDQGNIDLKLKSLQNQKAFWLYRHKVDFGDAIQEDSRNELMDRLNKLKEEYEDLEKKIKGKGIYNKIAGYSLLNYYQEIIDENQEDDNWENKPEIESKIQTVKQSIEKNEIELKSKNKEIKAVEYEISSTQQRTIESAIPDFKTKISELRYVQSRHQPKILYIDDKAEEGWSEIFQILIYGEKKEKIFKSISESNYETIKSEIEEMNPNLILLDLRLENESGTQRNVEDLSGAKILKRIREDYHGLPVMMTTASNKALSYETLIRLGADCFWTKEGIDISAALAAEKRASYSVENYKKFLKCINVLSSDDYQFLNRFGTIVNNMNKQKYESIWWWKDHTWEWKSFDYRLNKCVKEPPYCTRDFFSKNENLIDLIDRLFVCVTWYRKYLQNLLSGNELDPLDASRMVSYLGQIVELVHGGDEGYVTSIKVGFYFDKQSSILTEAGRFDFIGWCLFNFRNKASHYSTAKDFKKHYLPAFISGLLTWLEIDTYPDISKLKFSQNMSQYMASEHLVDFESWFEPEDSSDASTILEKIINLAGTEYSEKYSTLMR